MANVRNSNTLFIDTANSPLAVINTRALYVIVTATAANAVVVLSDNTTAAKKMDLRVAASGTTQVFDFSFNPVQFPTGINATTLTNAVVTVVIGI